MEGRQESGLQVAVLIFAVTLLAVPLGNWAIRPLNLEPEAAALATRMVPFFIGFMAYAAFPALRSRVHGLLSVRIPAEHRSETIAAVAFMPILLFAKIGGIALWAWMVSGPSGMAALTANAPSPAEQLARAMTTTGVLATLFFAGVIAPLFEEVVFRGLLQPAWERAWGWFPATILTSGLFGLYHPVFAAAFVGGIAFSCVYRRTGSLRSAIACHMASNLLTWYPLLGKYAFPVQRMDDPGTWWIHFSCVVISAIVLPAYLLIALWRPASTPVGSAPVA